MVDEDSSNRVGVSDAKEEWGNQTCSNVGGPDAQRTRGTAWGKIPIGVGGPNAQTTRRGGMRADSQTGG